MLDFLFFFFKQKTAYEMAQCDWSSDVCSSDLGPLFQFHLAVPDVLAMGLGIVLTVVGYACTLWCYAAMGNAWRICVNPKEKNQLVTSGPYRRMRHPIYSFQIVMLIGALLLLPTVFTALILAVHVV